MSQRRTSLLPVKDRRCSRSGCNERAVATLTFVYADSTAVIGPLAAQAEPGSYDLCSAHAHSMSVPRGWEVIRLTDAEDEAPEPDEDDLLALANAVREIGFGQGPDLPSQPDEANVVELAHRGHLRVIADRGGRR